MSGRDRYEVRDAPSVVDADDAVGRDDLIGAFPRLGDACVRASDECGRVDRFRTKEVWRWR